MGALSWARTRRLGCSPARSFGIQLAVSRPTPAARGTMPRSTLRPGGLGPGNGKKSKPHKNAVIGDTVGDPLKDTSGPSLNIVVKLSAIMSLVFGSVIANYSNESGGPFWLEA